MRIIAGQNRGMKLETLKGDNTRPTTDRVRESLFNILENYIIPENVLDLFAGSGAVGLECFSRYESNVTFVENNRLAFRVVEKNILKICKMSDKVEIKLSDALLFVKALKPDSFDFIYLDPPYERNCKDLIQELIDLEVLQVSGLIVYETNNLEYIKEVKNLISEGCGLKFSVIKEKKYGKTYLLFIERVK